jgi:hypothetical protein
MSMISSPQGAVTFLFTDIERSTKLWEEHHEPMKLALALHDRLLRQDIEGQPRRERKRRTRVEGVFPNEKSLEVLTTTVGLRVTGDWAFRRYLEMSLLEVQMQVQSGVA